MPALTVHNAEIKTAAVEIRTLTISGKQVTLAVFRQLREVPLINEDGNFSGLPWGTVNYHPDRCVDARHVHIVWQSGDELRRSRVDEPNWWRHRLWFDESDAFFQAEYCANEHEWPSWAEPKRIPGDVYDSPTFAVDRATLFANPPTSPSSSWRATFNPKHKCADVSDAARHVLRRDLAAVLRAEQSRRQRIDARWLELADLPQLFIAV